MKQRVITAIFFAAAMLGGIFYNKHTFFWLFLIVAAGCLWELMGLLLPNDENHFRFRRMAGSILGIFPVAIFGANALFTNWEWCGMTTPEEIVSGHFDGQVMCFSTILLIGTILIFLLFVAELFFAGKTPFDRIGSYSVGAIYISIPIALLFSIATTPDAQYHPYRVFGLLLLIWTNDTMAYFVGSQLGKNKLFERISPKKTWEGTIGGGICTMLIAWGLSFLIDDFTPAQWIALAAVAAVFGTLGDLVESMLKRSVGVKDSGTLLPGHGGLLDRFDAFIFALPFYWLILQALQD